MNLGTRAVLTRYAIGDEIAVCAGCRDAIKRHGGGHGAKNGTRLIRANIYDRGRWARAESFHPACYANAGEPYGPTGAYRHPIERGTFRNRGAAADITRARDLAAVLVPGGAA